MHRWQPQVTIGTFVVNGKRYRIPLIQGLYPVTHQVASVTVIHPVAALADGWATAPNVMGRESGMALAEMRLAVLMLNTRKTR